MTDEDDECPAFLTLLIEARQLAGNPSKAALARNSGISAAQVWRIFNNRSHPSRGTLFMLATALAPTNAKVVEDIMAAYDGVRLDRPRPAAEPSADAKAIADALREGLSEIAKATLKIASAMHQIDEAQRRRGR